MLFYKAWVDTRTRFFIGLAILAMGGCGSVLAYPRLLELMPLASTTELTGPLGDEVRQSMELARSFGGYIWSQWFRQNATQLMVLFAVLLGTGGLAAQRAGGVALFTLALPMARAQLVGAQAVTGLVQVAALAAVAALTIPLVAPVIGQRYGLVDAVVHATCLFAGGAVFLALASWLSTLFEERWKSVLLAVCVPMLLAVVERLTPDWPNLGFFRVMSAGAYFQGGGLPWVGLLVSLLVAGGLFYAAARQLEAIDF